MRFTKVVLVSPAILLTLALGATRAQGQNMALPGCVLKPVPPCTLVNTAAIDDKFQPGETRTFFVRGETTDFSAQGGEATGCGIPGLSGGDPQTNRARAIAVNVKTLGIAGRGTVKVWPADEADTPLPIDNFEDTPEQIKFNNFAIIPICDEVATDPCVDGDVKVQVNGAATHVKLEVFGYFVEADGANVVTVAVPGGDFLSIQDAIDSILDAGPNNPYLIKVDPGLYVENGTIALKPYVNIEGAGEGSTILSATADVIVEGADNVDLSSLTIRASAGTDLIGLLNDNASPHLVDVTLDVSGGSSSNVAISNVASSPVLEDIVATALGTGGVAILNDATSNPLIRLSILNGTVNAVVNALGGQSKIIDTQVTGGLGGLGHTCIGSYTGAFSLLSILCL